MKERARRKEREPRCRELQRERHTFELVPNRVEDLAVSRQERPSRANPLAAGHEQCGRFRQRAELVNDFSAESRPRARRDEQLQLGRRPKPCAERLVRVRREGIEAVEDQ